jgi:hypothetical protein
LISWAKRCDPSNDDDAEHSKLIAKHQAVTADDFRRIGKSKDSEDGDVAAFLEDWSSRAVTRDYNAAFPSWKAQWCGAHRRGDQKLFRAAIRAASFSQ